MNIRFALANVKSRIEEGPEDANVQAHSRQTREKHTWKPLNRDGKETRSCQNEPRAAFGGLLKNLVLVKSDKRMTDYLIEQVIVV